MLLSKATEEDVIITSKSMSNLVKDCLKYGAPYIITRRCNQGEYFVVDMITAVNCCCVGSRWIMICSYAGIASLSVHCENFLFDAAEVAQFDTPVKVTYGFTL